MPSSRREIEDLLRILNETDEFEKDQYRIVLDERPVARQVPEEAQMPERPLKYHYEPVSRIHNNITALERRAERYHEALQAGVENQSEFLGMHATLTMLIDQATTKEDRQRLHRLTTGLLHSIHGFKKSPTVRGPAPTPAPKKSLRDRWIDWWCSHASDRARGL